MAQLIWLMLTFVLMFGAFQGPAEATLTFNLGNEGPIQTNQKLVFVLFTSWVGGTSAAPVATATLYVASTKYDHVLKPYWCACREERKSLTNETEQQQFDKCERIFLHHGSDLLEETFLKGGNNNTDEMQIEMNAWTGGKIKVVNCTDFKIDEEAIGLSAEAIGLSAEAIGLSAEVISAIVICGVGFFSSLQLSSESTWQSA